MIIESLKEGLRGGDREGRCAVIAASLLSISVYVSGMAFEVAIAAIAISLIATKGRSLKLLRAFLPFYLLFAITALFSGISALKTLLAFLAIISSGSIVFSSQPSEVSGALLFFRFPEKFVSLLQIALSMLPVVVSDFENVKSLYGRSYYRLLKAFVSTAILRAVSFSESLYSKNFSYKAVKKMRRPEKADYLLLLASTAVFVYAISLEVSTWMPSST
ncbi:MULTISPECIES: hypothetical protein [Archaeoglobus]|jgi:energy-coupling factor transport system permease protein|uniref:Energy-coupling factor transporter transmembrane protein EcfT n=3 Tax=Archaeoglobus fulgidus TaxID=2234 RepID=O29096_ARCFU|nr:MULTISPECIES: hypothetical protein [Archaeoglobus]AAB90087.1 predicted coding region AF_1171 [Archaeoglobus fulgidus DSM 4304]AIG98045.1 hypothetical protein AFULGI_00012700 [Archaeoglobus fulgidus DSM 8774]KUJ93227.1 MAG: hypothetical protein XD40_1565 [Archaeoglobus fulgidus]KUK06878.1 MAG: hypothetical protein XD48_0874 [Archaeoglobus fulgidus]MDI3497591.1 energy-coupling factor transport system permease protein [Archaeoglobus sp.]